MESGDDVRSDWPDDAVAAVPPMKPKALPKASEPHGSSIPVEEIEPSEGMYRSFLAGDRVGALKLAEDILVTRPDDVLAASVLAQCRPPALVDVAIDMNAVPEVLAPLMRVSTFELDLRTVFLLTCIDGASTVEQIVDRAGIGRPDVLHVLANLASAGVIRLRKR